jgi:hypothetical protein
VLGLTHRGSRPLVRLGLAERVARRRERLTYRVEHGPRGVLLATLGSGLLQGASRSLSRWWRDAKFSVAFLSMLCLVPLPKLDKREGRLLKSRPSSVCPPCARIRRPFDENGAACARRRVGRFLSLVRLRRVREERLDGARRPRRLGAALLLKLIDPVRHGVDHVAGRFLGRFPLGLLGNTLFAVALVALDNFYRGFLCHDLLLSFPVDRLGYSFNEFPLPEFLLCSLERRRAINLANARPQFFKRPGPSLQTISLCPVHLFRRRLARFGPKNFTKCTDSQGVSRTPLSWLQCVHWDVSACLISDRPVKLPHCLQSLCGNFADCQTPRLAPALCQACRPTGLVRAAPSNSKHGTIAEETIHSSSNPS